MAPAIRVENLGKKYRVTRDRGRTNYRTLRESLIDAAAGPIRRLRHGFGKPDSAEDFWALTDVSFDVRPGEVVGIIGRNGAGKSTLLKILSRITKPTAGRVEINGRVGSLLEVGTGFHPELTGRENIYLNGSILGMSKKEIDRRFDEIVSFAEVERFLDTPVKRYSSGMYVRLAFAVAAHLEPEVLIVDEVLAVGDAEFQKKCMHQMKRVSSSGRTILFVSHNMAAVENLCTTCLFFSAGCLAAAGPTQKVIADYQAHWGSTGGWKVDLAGHRNRTGSEVRKLQTLTFSSDGEPTATIKMGDHLEIAIDYRCVTQARHVKVGLMLEDARGYRVVSFSPTFQCPHLFRNAPLSGRAVCSIPSLNLVDGYYTVNVFYEDDQGAEGVLGAGRIEVLPKDVFGTGKIPDSQIGVVFAPAKWNVVAAGSMPAA
jgi:lipopolysaccharide transport system ATP-binding protein